MASRRAFLQFFALLFVVAACSSFTFADESSKSEEQQHTDKDTSAQDDSSQEDSKEKRSQEEILFGNQQNKPSGLVDDLMGMTNTMGDDENSSSNVPEKKSSSDSLTTEVDNVDETGADDGAMVDKSDLMMGPGGENWYSPLPPAANPMQYLANGPTLKQSLPSEDFPNSLYDQEDLYRRKRQLFSHPLPLRKRSLRSSLGQMIQKRGIRLPRRSMRLKRQVDDLVGLFGNERYFDEEPPQMTHHSFSGRAQTVAKRHVPGRFSGYPETPEYRYPYVFQHRDDGVMSEGDLEEDPLEAADEIDSLMLLPPHSRYVDGELLPYRTREDENEAIQKWLSRHTTPSVFRVSRRSAPFFYPIDYRYMPAPGFKKRSSRFNNGGRSSHFSEEESEGGPGEFGKWGHVVQMPEAYASPEDVARLYGLASLMADEGDAGNKRRRAA